MKIRNIVAFVCATFIVVCNLKYAHDGYGVRNAKPEERGYATTAKPTYRHEKYPYNIMCDAIVIYVHVYWPLNHLAGRPAERDSVEETFTAAGSRIWEARAKARQIEAECKAIDDSCRVVIDDFFSIQKAPYPSYELRCEPSGNMIDCQNETGDDCPLIS